MTHTRYADIELLDDRPSFDAGDEDEPGRQKKHFWTRPRLVAAVVALALLLRLWAAWQLPVDADEPTYLQAGYDYARLIRAGNVQDLVDYRGNAEHPPLGKLLIALALLPLGPHPDWTQGLMAGRLVSVAFGTLSVLVVALFNPLAGLALAVQTLVVKYTSQAYLEALPLFGALLALFSLLRSRRGSDRWFWLSACALGLTAAGKYAYVPVLVVIVYLFFAHRRYSWQLLIPYLAIAGLVFFILNPALWADPIGRLADSLFFHLDYSQSQHVQDWAYPWWQPFVWLTRSMPFEWHPDVFFYFGFDGLIAFLAALGLKINWRDRPWVVVWIAAGTAFLLVWPTKWPQYALVVLPALCIGAAFGFQSIYARLREADMYWNWMGDMFIRPSRLLVTLTVVVIGIVMFGGVLINVRRAIIERGWYVLNTANTALPSDTVYSILALPERQMLLAGEGGAVLFDISPDTNLPQSWEVYTTANSGLPSNRVFDLARDSQGNLWFATTLGLARFDGQAWQAYRGQDMGLASDLVQSTAVDSQDRVWAATRAGLAVYADGDWRTYTRSNSGLANDSLLSLAILPLPGGEQIWVASSSGVSRLDSTTGRWHNFPSAELGIGIGGISNLSVDSQGGVWVTTYSYGMLRWDGQAWQTFRVSNSELASNTVTGIFETQPGIFWIATAHPTDVGGVLTRYDGQTWQRFTPSNSGYSGAEPLAVTLDEAGRLWIGTRTQGISIYQRP